MVMRIINYTNVCVAQCDYCAFYVLPNQGGGYVLSRNEVFAKIDELVEFGGDLVAFNGGFNPRLPLEYYCDLFASVRERYGERVEFYALTIAEFVFLADRAGLSYADAAARLRDAGVHWVTGGGSEILTEDFRKRHAKFKYTVREYFDAQRAIVESGLKTTATMVIGFDRILAERGPSILGLARPDWSARVGDVNMRGFGPYEPPIAKRRGILAAAAKAAVRQLGPAVRSAIDRCLIENEQR